MEMKRNSIIAAAVCLAALASCQKQEIVESPSLAKVDVELTASSDLNSTKTVMTEYNNHWWSVSDKISLFYKVDGTSAVRHSVFTSKNLIPSATARFAGTLSLPAEDTDLKTVSAIAVYPTAAEGASSDGTSVTVTVPAVQTAVEGTFMEGAYPVVAQTSDLTAALSFKAVCGGVKVSFQTPGITSFTFDGKDSKIAGTASVTFDTDGNPVATTDESAVSVITVNAPAGGFEVGKWYYMTALPATISGGYKITLHGGEADGKELTGSSNITIKRSVFGVLDSKDAPDTYADFKANWKSIAEWELEKDYITDLQPAEGTGDKNELTLSQRTKFKRGLNTLKISSDASYIYGYMEINTSEYASSANALKNLALWIDADETHVGQGGGWYFSARKGFEKAVFGSISGDWNPDLYDQTKVGTALGTKITTKSKPGYGAGQYDGSVLKYSFVLDRRVIGIRNMSNIVLGISFFGTSWGNDYLINPDRGGFVLSLKNSQSDVDNNPDRILKSLKPMSYWESVEKTDFVRGKYDKGNSVVKFDVDDRFVYGYIEVNTNDLLWKNWNNHIYFSPASIRNLVVALDTDGKSEGQGPNFFDYKGYDVVFRGSSATTQLIDDKGWPEANGWPGYGVNFGLNDYVDKYPEYLVTPQTWKPSAYEMKESASNWGATSLGLEDNMCLGQGEWNAETKVFKYSFALDKKILNNSGINELAIGIAFYGNGTAEGAFFIPSSTGFTIKLNNN